MFRNWSIRKYCLKLPERLSQRYGQQKYYTPSQVRATVYQCDFNEKFLPLGYLLYLSVDDCARIMAKEFPDINPEQYKRSILSSMSDNPSLLMQIKQILS